MSEERPKTIFTCDICGAKCETMEDYPGKWLKLYLCWKPDDSRFRPISHSYDSCNDCLGGDETLTAKAQEKRKSIFDKIVYALKLKKETK